MTRRWPRSLRTDDVPLQDYYGYILLDFVTADRDLEELPLAAATFACGKRGIEGAVFEIAKRELRLRKRQLESIDQDKEKLLAQAPTPHAPREAGDNDPSNVRIASRGASGNCHIGRKGTGTFR